MGRSFLTVEKMQVWIALCVTTVWTVSMIYDMMSTAYNPPSGVQVAFLPIIGFLFTYRKPNHD